MSVEVGNVVNAHESGAALLKQARNTDLPLAVRKSIASVLCGTDAPDRLLDAVCGTANTVRPDAAEAAMALAGEANPAVVAEAAKPAVTATSEAPTLVIHILHMPLFSALLSLA